MKKCIFRKGKEFFTEISGSIMPLTALILPVILGMAGVGLDASRWAMEHRNLQTAADAAAVAAAWELAYNLENNAETAALQEAQNNGFDPDNGSFILDIGEDDDGNPTVSATIMQSSASYLSALVNSNSFQNSVKATALVTIGNGNFCMLSLDPSASSAFVVDGTATIDSGSCGLAANSNSATAFNINGGGNGDVIVDNVTTVGGIEDRNNHIQGDTITNSAPIPDPYEDLDIPNYTGCSQIEMNNNTVKTTADSVVYCGGLTVPNGTSMTLDPDKVHIIDGGDLNVGNGETLEGEGVSIIMTNSGEDSYGDWGKMDIKGTLDISAPQTDGLLDYWEEFEGVAIYEDRNAPEGPSIQCHDMKGDVKIDGTAYFPSGCLDIGGNGSTVPNEGVCSRIIATTIRAHGNPVIGSDCDDSAAKDIGIVTVRLTY